MSNSASNMPQELVTIYKKSVWNQITFDVHRQFATLLKVLLFWMCVLRLVMTIKVPDHKTHDILGKVIPKPTKKWRINLKNGPVMK